VIKEGLLHARFGGAYYRAATATPNFSSDLHCAVADEMHVHWKARMDKKYREKGQSMLGHSQSWFEPVFDAATKLCADYDCMLALIRHLLTTTSKLLTYASILR
jgi:hypothetical protein